MRQDTDDYCAILQDEYEQRAKRNPAYSLRAFARHLDVSISFLSELLRGQKRLTEKRAFAVAERLGLEARDTRLFATLVRYKHARDDRARGAIGAELAQLRGANGPRFQPIQSETIKSSFVWYYLGLHELATREDFDRDPAWIARQLGISVEQAIDATQSLIAAGMLVEVDGRLTPSTMNIVFTKPDPALIQRYHRFMLDKAHASVGRSDEASEFGSILMGFDPDSLPRAIEVIRRFQAEMTELSLQSRKRRVYQFAVQLHPIDRD